MMNGKNVILFGPPGAGKGTQAAKLREFLSVPHISTGEMFRYHISSDTELGAIAKEYINKGNLVPDEVTIAMVKDRLQQSDISAGFLLDGFPRSVPQAIVLDSICKELKIVLSYVINIAIPDEEIRDRLTKRASIEGRADDADIHVIQQRIENYKNQSEPCLGYYRPKSLVHDINGTGTIDEVFKKTITIFD